VYGTGILISESTYVQVSDQLTCRELDRIRVVGRARPVAVYEVVGADGLSAEKQTLLEMFEAALEQYRERRWDEARALFHRILESYPDDGASKLYAHRCEQMEKNPPPDDWQGVHLLASK